MGQPKLRNMNAELQEGLLDGKYKRVRPDATNLQFPDGSKQYTERMQDLAWPYGVNEPDEAFTPEGKYVRRRANL